MTKRSLLSLCVGLVLAVGVAIWFLSKEPAQTLQHVQTERSSEHAAELAQEPSFAQVGGVERTQATPQVAQTLAPRLPDAGASAKTENQQVPTSADNNSSGARVAAVNTQSQDEAATPVLSEQVFAVIEDVQQKQMDGKWEESLVELNALYEDFDNLNSFEQTTLLNFYTNTLIRFEMWPEAIGAFSRMLTVPDLRPDLGARALMALGQLHAQVGEYAASITYLTTWQDLTAGMENMERSNERVTQLLAQTRLAAQQSSIEEQ